MLEVNGAAEQKGLACVRYQLGNCMASITKLKGWHEHFMKQKELSLHCETAVNKLGGCTNSFINIGPV